jgi:hypothetical protein
MMVRRLRRPALALAASAALLGLIAIGACGSGGVGIGVCRQIEEARCRQAGVCNISPLDTLNFTSGTAVEACIQYYDDQCFHGLVVGSNPPAASVNACVNAIQKGCKFVLSPQSSPECAWLSPPDAAAEAAAAEASEELDGSSTDAADASSSQ